MLNFHTNEDQDEILETLKHIPHYASFRYPKTYISLTSSPERLKNVGLMLSLLDLSKISEIHINLPKHYRNDPKLTYNPDDIRFLERLDSRIKVFVIKKDLGPVTKILPTLMRIKSGSVISVDDDIAYPFDMISQLMNAAVKTPNQVTCGGGFTFGGKGMGKYGEYFESTNWQDMWPAKSAKYPFVDILEGYSSVIYNKKLFTKSVIDLILELNKSCKLSDDLTISYSLASHGIKIKSLKRGEDIFSFSYGEGADALHVGEGGVDANFIKYEKCLKGLAGLDESGPEPNLKRKTIRKTGLKKRRSRKIKSPSSKRRSKRKSRS